MTEEAIYIFMCALKTLHQAVLLLLLSIKDCFFTLKKKQKKTLHRLSEGRIFLSQPC